jgi:hypothetical protein
VDNALGSRQRRVGKTWRLLLLRMSEEQPPSGRVLLWTDSSSPRYPDQSRGDCSFGTSAATRGPASSTSALARRSGRAGDQNRPRPCRPTDQSIAAAAGLPPRLSTGLGMLGRWLLLHWLAGASLFDDRGRLPTRGMQSDEKRPFVDASCSRWLIRAFPGRFGVDNSRRETTTVISAPPGILDACCSATRARCARDLAAGAAFLNCTPVWPAGSDAPRACWGDSARVRVSRLLGRLRAS